MGVVDVTFCHYFKELFLVLFLASQSTDFYKIVYIGIFINFDWFLIKMRFICYMDRIKLPFHKFLRLLWPIRQILHFNLSLLILNIFLIFLIFLKISDLGLFLAKRIIHILIISHRFLFTFDRNFTSRAALGVLFQFL